MEPDDPDATPSDEVDAQPADQPAIRIDGDDETSTPRPVDKFHRTAVGSVVAAGLLGLRDALEGRPEKEEITIVSEAPTSPVDDDITLVFDEDDPNALKVIVPKLPKEHER